jgi:hypothetical protein
VAIESRLGYPSTDGSAKQPLQLAGRGSLQGDRAAEAIESPLLDRRQRL